ncbi:hypothetical protein JEQ12_019046 [Ovis aries]|uniref:Uncharacterized protein n=1 Tax=Ovis aries TaxID=9940 RepID=A0A836A1U1_SHEEP|nr:hypothetical protein JEQ12_019046 [Ovis aries]
MQALVSTRSTEFSKTQSSKLLLSQVAQGKRVSDVLRTYSDQEDHRPREWTGARGAKAPPASGGEASLVSPKLQLKSETQSAMQKRAPCQRPFGDPNGISQFLGNSQTPVQAAWCRGGLADTAPQEDHCGPGTLDQALRAPQGTCSLLPTAQSSRLRGLHTLCEEGPYVQASRR